MTLTAEPRQTTTAARTTVRTRRRGSLIVKWITSTDHKTIGHLYLITSFVFFLLALPDAMFALGMGTEFYIVDPLPSPAATPDLFEELFTPLR